MKRVSCVDFKSFCLSMKGYVDQDWMGNVLLFTIKVTYLAGKTKGAGPLPKPTPKIFNKLIVFMDTAKVK